MTTHLSLKRLHVDEIFWSVEAADFFQWVIPGVFDFVSGFLEKRDAFLSVGMIVRGFSSIRHRTWSQTEIHRLDK